MTVDALHLLHDCLESFGYPVFLQGSMTADESYPETFFTYYNNTSSGALYYDNLENANVWDFDVNAYSANPDTAQEILLDARDALRAIGFVVTGAGYDIMSDEPTHVGRGINAIYLERVNANG